MSERSASAEGDGPPSEPTREELEARIEDTRRSIAETVDQIKGAVGERVDAVSSTVAGVVTLADQFQREPVAWSLGALSAGFAMGYSLGRAHHVKRGSRPSRLARFADDLAAELADFGDALVSPELSAELKTTFGVDLRAALARIAAQQTRPRRRPPRVTPRTPARTVSPRTAGARSRRKRKRPPG
jgi:hypothetical protein